MPRHHSSLEYPMPFFFFLTPPSTSKATPTPNRIQDPLPQSSYQPPRRADSLFPFHLIGSCFQLRLFFILLRNSMDFPKKKKRENARIGLQRQKTLSKKSKSRSKRPIRKALEESFWLQRSQEKQTCRETKGLEVSGEKEKR